MAKRSAAPTPPSYSTVSISDSRQREGAVGRFLREQIFAPDKMPGNIGILIGTGFFAASIAATRLWGSLLLVPTTS